VGDTTENAIKELKLWALNEDGSCFLPSLTPLDECQGP